MRVIDDLDMVKRLQAGHGEWTDDMAPVSPSALPPHPQLPRPWEAHLRPRPLPTQALGHIGRVLKVFGDGNLGVLVSGKLWTFSPSCLVAYRPEEDANLDVAKRARENKSEGIQRGRLVGGGAAPGHHRTSALPSPGSLSVVLDKLRAQKSDLEHPGRLVVEVALGNVARALDLLRRHPEQASS